MVLYERYVGHSVRHCYVCIGCTVLISTVAIDCISLRYIQFKNRPEKVKYLHVMWIRMTMLNASLYIHSFTAIGAVSVLTLLYLKCRKNMY